MIDEDLLRSALSTLGMHPPLPEDRVGEVRERVRRRSRARAAAGTVAALAVLATVAALALPGDGGARDSLPARPAPSAEVADYRLPITQAVVVLPGSPYEATLQLVDQALAPLGLPGRTGRTLSEEQGPDGPVRVDFVRALDAGERGRAVAALTAVPGAQVDVRDVPGFDLRLVAPLSDEVRSGLLARGALLPEIGPGALADALGGVYSVEPDEDARRLAVGYTGPALSDAALATARREVARLAGVPVDQVRLRAGGQAG